VVFGAIILAVGIIALLQKLNVISGSVWDYTWPVILVIIGLSFILGRFRRRRWRWFWGAPPWDNRDRDRKD
jgi:drug/metabolite transporter (DMT)-like permease